LSKAVERGRVIGECANFTRGLANEPANVLTPEEFADRVTRAAAGVGLRADVLDEPRIRELGMRLLLSVSQGSALPPRLIVLRHEPDGAPTTPVLGLIGKGITFDTGGVSIKPAEGMERMKDDMAGGCRGRGCDAGAGAAEGAAPCHRHHSDVREHGGRPRHAARRRDSRRQRQDREIINTDAGRPADSRRRAVVRAASWARRTWWTSPR
jgi:leucyl aminopeptidase